MLNNIKKLEMSNEVREITELEFRAIIWEVMAKSNHIQRNAVESHSKKKSKKVKEAIKNIDKGLSLPLSEIKSISFKFTSYFRKAVELLRSERNGHSNEPLHIPVSILNSLFQNYIIIDESDVPF